MFRFESNGDKLEVPDAPFYAGGKTAKGAPLKMSYLSSCGETKTLQVTRFGADGQCGSLRIGLSVTCPTPLICRKEQTDCLVDDDCCPGLMCNRNRKSLKHGQCVPQPNSRTCVRSQGACGGKKRRCCFGFACKKLGSRRVCLPKPKEQCVKENERCVLGRRCCEGLVEQKGVDSDRCVPAPQKCVKIGNVCRSHSDCCVGAKCYRGVSGHHLRCGPEQLEPDQCYVAGYGIIRKNSCLNGSASRNSAGCCTDSGRPWFRTNSKVH